MDYFRNLNEDQIRGYLLTLFGVTGPLANILASTFKLDNQTVTNILGLGTVLTPILAGVIYTFFQSNAKKVEAVAKMDPETQHAALSKVSDEAKVKIAEAVPGVATVVVKDDANGALAKIAASPEHPHIVTESKNQADATIGYAPKEGS